LEQTDWSLLKGSIPTLLHIWAVGRTREVLEGFFDRVVGFAGGLVRL
jgi:hypothetical protein